MIILINTNKIFISGTLDSYVTKLSNSGLATFSETHIRIQDLKVLFAAEVGKVIQVHFAPHGHCIFFITSECKI